jgi:hypothetical protein
MTMPDPSTTDRSTPVAPPPAPHIGFIGDAWSGTLTCNHPGCGWEKFVNTFDAEDEADAHWASHASIGDAGAPSATRDEVGQ